MMRFHIMQAPSKCAASGVLKNAIPCPEPFAMALSDDRMAFASFRSSNIQICDLSGAELCTFGAENAQFRRPRHLCTHPNGNLLVMDSTRGMEELTWTGTHVRLICSQEMNGWHPTQVAVSPDGSLIAVLAGHVGPDGDSRTIEVFDGITRSPVHSFQTDNGRYNMRFSTDGSKIVAGGVTGFRPVLFDLRAGSEAGIEFGTPSACWQDVEFTHSGDMIVCDNIGASVYCGKTAVLQRAWPWARAIMYVYAIQAYRGSLYVLCRVLPDALSEVHVYE